eukprot:4184055-Pleurochrysis_carterae.AAC.2
MRACVRARAHAIWPACARTHAVFHETNALTHPHMQVVDDTGRPRLSPLAHNLCLTPSAGSKPMKASVSNRRPQLFKQMERSTSSRQARAHFRGEPVLSG